MGKTAFVVGANGITGSYLVEHLLRHPAFTRVVATSRRPPNAEWVARDLPPDSMADQRLTWIAADLIDESIEALAEKFGKAGVGDAAVLFWGAYLMGPDGWGSASETEINRKMFDNCLRGVLSVNHGNLERVLLQLGEKWYFRTPTPSLPQKEIDDPPQGATLAPFYEAQLSIAKSLGKTHNFSWTCTLPQCILGSTRQCFMTLATQLGVYLFAHRLLGKPAVFPGSKAYWNAVTDATDAGLLAELNTWAALEPKCAGQILNAVNGDVFQWRFIWYRLVAYFGCTAPPEDEMLALLPETGIGLTASSILPPETLSALWSECSATLAKNDPNFDAQGWRGSQPWTFFESVFAIQTNLFQSSTKLRKLGWAGYMDTEECFYAIFDRMTRDGFFPSGVLPGREAGRKAFKY